MTSCKVEEKQSHYRPGQAQRVPGRWGSQISRQSANECGKDVSPTHRPPLPQEIFLVLISLRGRVTPRAIVRPKGLYQWKTRMTPSGIEPASFRLLKQCLNQLRYRVPPLLRIEGLIIRQWLWTGVELQFVWFSWFCSILIESLQQLILQKLNELSPKV